MVLKPNRAAGGNAGDMRVVDDFVIVEHDGDMVADERDLHRVPLADVLVGVPAGCRGCPRFWWQTLVAANAPELSGAGRPAPEIHLGATAEQDSGVRIGKFDDNRLARLVQ